jgi:hypothetical protein
MFSTPALLISVFRFPKVIWMGMLLLTAGVLHPAQAQEWGDDMLLSTYMGTPVMATSSNGDMYVVGETGSVDLKVFKSTDDGNTWQSFTTVNRTSNKAVDPDIATYDNDLYLTHIEGRNIYVTIITPTGATEKYEVQIPTPYEFRADPLSPRITVDRLGNIHVAFIEEDSSSDNDLYHAFKNNTGSEFKTKDVVEYLTFDKIVGDGVDIASTRDESSNAPVQSTMMCFQTTDAGIACTRTDGLDSSGNWEWENGRYISDVPDIPSGYSRFSRPRIAETRLGAFVVYEGTNPTYGDSDLFGAITTNAGTSWSYRNVIQTSGDVKNAAITESPFSDDEFHLLFQRGTSVFHRTLTESSGGWSSAKKVSDRDEASDVPVAISVNEQGRAVAAWEVQRASGASVRFDYQRPEPASLQVSPPEIPVDSDGGTETISVSNTGEQTMSWTASRDQSWVTITSGARGTNDGTVALSISENTSTSQRSATVTIDAGPAGKKDIPVKQEGRSRTPAALEVSPPEIPVDSDGGTETISVSNTGEQTMSWTASRDQSWVTITPAHVVPTTAPST